VATESVLLKPREAADYLRVSPSTLHRLRRRKQLKVVRIGSSVRYSRTELDRVIHRNTR